MVAPYPEPDPEMSEPEIEEQVEILKEAISTIRRLRAENLVPLSARVEVLILADEKAGAEFFERNRIYLESPPQVNIKELKIQAGGEKPPSYVSSRIKNAMVCVDLAGLIDFEKEENRLKKEQAKLKKELERVEKSLARPGFLEKAPAEVVERQKAVREEILSKLSAVEENLRRLDQLRQQLT